VALNLFKDALALVLFIPTLLLLNVPLFSPEHTVSDWVVLLLSGTLGIGIADSLFFAGLNRLGAGRASIVCSLYSPFVVICAYFYLDEPLGLPLVLGMGLMAGAILVGNWEPWTARTAEERRRMAAGVALSAASVLLMAAGIVLAKPVLNRADPWWAATVRLIGGCAFLAAQGMSRRHRRAVIEAFRPNRSWRVAVPGGLLGAYVAMIIWIMGFKYTSAGVAGVLNETNMIFVLILGAVFLHEPITTRKVAAVLMAFAGAAAVVWR
jgi:drug/metabolite transporter (DMT)-like permease